MAICLLLAACASLPSPKPADAGVPLLRLSPASLGRSLFLQQALTVDAGGQTHRFDVVLEADDLAVRLAVLNLGQTVARLEWDGTRLTQSSAAWWPAAVRGERVLSDLQLMLWPSAEIAAALPPGWTLDATEAGQRVLRDGPDAVATVTYLSPVLSELTQRRQGYRIRVVSRPLAPAP